MATLGFFNCVSNQPIATEKSVESIRQFYPDAFFMIACDAGPSYYDMCKKHNIQYYHSQVRLGYPVQPYGYRPEQMLEWLSRFYIACLKTDTTHLMMVEDDVILVKPVTVLDEWECAGHNITEGNVIPSLFLEELGLWNPPIVQYGAGGGSIFKVSTFLEVYPKVVDFIKTYGKDVQEQIYPTMGWMDCYMTWIYIMAGKEYTRNTRMLNIWPTDKNFDLSKVAPEIEIVHNYKNYYV